MDKLLEVLKVPASIAGVISIIFIILQVVGELCSIKGKIVPEWMKLIHKIKEHRDQKKQDEKDRVQALKDVKILLNKVNKHYDEDNITQRNLWMTKVNENIEWTHERAQAYDSSIDKLTNSMSNVVIELERLRKQTEEDHAQRIRNKVIEFASKIARDDYRATKDEFNYIFRIYHEYEEYITAHHIQNDQINACIEIIREEYKDYTKHNRFLEAKRSLPN